MNTFTRKTLYAAITGAAAIGAASFALAVNLSADGLGQVLIYPYYTVNNDINGNAFNTLMSVVNTTASTKAVKVRFREGRASVEVLDFNVFLSPFDVWTATVTPTAAGGAHIATTDKSCTIPTFPAGGQDFLGGAYASDKDNSITRTSEGYFEVFEMVTYTDAGVVGTNAKHANGVPKDCSKVTDITASVAAEQGPPTGGLFGNEIIVNPFGGGAFSAPATALDNFRVAGLYFSTGSPSPTYQDVQPPISNVIFGNGLFTSTWLASPVNAVTAVLMANAITNEYVLDKGTQSQTSWVVTQPTKFLYVTTSTFAAPYTTKYVDVANGTGGGACEPTFGVVFDREEGQPQTITGFSPQTTPGASICWETTVLNFRTSTPATTDAAANIFGSRNFNGVDTLAFQSGWSTFGLNNPGAVPIHSMGPATVTQRTDLQSGTQSFVPVVYYGLPIVGFAAETFNNNALSIGGKTFLSTFGATLPHHKSVRIQ